MFPAVAIEPIDETTTFTETLGTPTRTEPLNIGSLTGSVDHLADEGWKWDATGESSGTLTLKGFHLQTSGQGALKLQDNSIDHRIQKLEIVLEGTNVVEATGMFYGAVIENGIGNQNVEYTIRQAEGQRGSLEFVNTSAQWNEMLKAPYVFSGTSLTIESGTITSNMEFAIIFEAFTMNGGTLTVRNDEHLPYAGIYTDGGPLTINGGTVNIKAWLGMFVPGEGNGVDGGIYINGGDITIEGDGSPKATGLYAKQKVMIHTTGSLKTLNQSRDIYVKNGSQGEVTITKAKELSLGGANQIMPADVQTTIAPADYTALTTLIEKANALDPADYEDFTAVAATLTRAEKVISEKKNLLQQNEVDDVVAALDKAIEALVPKPIPTPPSGGGSTVVPSKGLEIMSAPTKTEYAYGENIDLTGLMVSDKAGGKLSVDEFVLSGYDAANPGVQRITLALKEDPKQAASFEVLVMFRDVDDTTPHHEEIKTLLEHDITRGFDDGTFRGMSTLNRQDLAAFLYRLAGQPDYEPAEADFVFADVTTATPHYREILWAAKRGVIRGFEAADGTRTFAGGRDILRQDMVAMLWRLAGSPVAKDGVSFSDVTADTPHREAIAWAKAAGVTTGFPDGTFKGGSTIVRQDTAAFLGRMIDKNLVKL